MNTQEGYKGQFLIMYLYLYICNQAHVHRIFFRERGRGVDQWKLFVFRVYLPVNGEMNVFMYNKFVHMFSVGEYYIFRAVLFCMILRNELIHDIEKKN